MTATFVGIDVSKDRLDVFIRPINEAMQVGNDDESIDRLVQRIKPYHPALIVMEATGAYHRLLLARLVAANLPAIAVNPLSPTSRIKFVPRSVRFRNTRPNNSRLFALVVGSWSR